MSTCSPMQFAALVLLFCYSSRYQMGAVANSKGLVLRDGLNIQSRILKGKHSKEHCEKNYNHLKGKKRDWEPLCYIFSSLL